MKGVKETRLTQHSDIKRVDMEHLMSNRHQIYVEERPPGIGISNRQMKRLRR